MACALWALGAPMRRSLSLFPALTLLLFLGPILAGLLGTLLPAFGYLPALGGERLSLAPWRALLAEPGLASAVTITLTAGLGATLIAFLIAVGTVAAFHDRPAFAALRRALAPALAVPHAAFAIGIGFLLAPSGWLARLVSPWATGWELPPDLMTVNDPAGFALMAALALKESLFLILMILAALGQIEAEKRLSVARVMGYRPLTAWFKVVLPAVYPQIRLPVYVVLAYTLSVVDMAIILGPSAPPPLAVLLLDWFRDFNVDRQFMAAAGALLQMLLAFGAIGLWALAARGVACAARPWLVAGGRGGPLSETLLRGLGGAGATIVAASMALSVAILALWGVSEGWRWPDALPAGFSLETFSRALPIIGQPLSDTLLIGLTSTAVAMLLVIGCLEHEVRRNRPPGHGGMLLIYLPLLLPQIGFLFGVQMLWIRFDLDGGRLAVAWTHLLFVLPLVYLTLAEPYRALDPRIARTAHTLGASPLRVVLAVKLPILIRPVMTALAIGFAVSVAQYLPTLFAGGGRVPTLTTEAVSLASGADRRLLSVVALLQAALPLIAFAAALALPAFLARTRKGLAV